MAQYFAVHPETPQPRLIRQAAEIVRRGGVIAYPSDSSYALGCRLGDADATECKSNAFEMEWPRGSGRMRAFPELDRFGWFDARLIKELRFALFPAWKISGS